MNIGKLKKIDNRSFRIKISKEVGRGYKKPDTIRKFIIDKFDTVYRVIDTYNLNL